MKFWLILSVIGCAFVSNDGSIVDLRDKYGNSLGYGAIVAPYTILLPKNVEDVYPKLRSFKRIDNKIEYNLLSSTLTKVNDVTFVIKLGNESRGTDDVNPTSIFRYPIHDSDLNGASEHHGIIFHNSNKIIGFSKGGKTEYLVEKYDNFPIYTKKCSYTLDDEAYIYCNSMDLSRDLKESGHPEIGVFGSVQGGFQKTFVSKSLTLIVGDNHAIAFSDMQILFGQIENFEIYGDGKNIEATLISGEKIVTGAIMNYTDISFGFKLIKFFEPIFRGMPKAKFIDDETYENSTDEWEVFRFHNQKFVLQNQSDHESGEQIPLVTPVFVDGKVVGFQKNGSFFSAHALKDVLKESIYSIDFETVSSTKNPAEMLATTTTAAAVPIPVDTPIGIQEKPVATNKKTFNSSTKSPSKSKAVADNSNTTTPNSAKPNVLYSAIIGVALFVLQLTLF